MMGAAMQPPSLSPPTTTGPATGHEQAATGQRHPLVRLEGVGLAYGAVWALRGVGFSIHTGDRLALVGPNGAGKSSLLRLLAGLQQPTCGRLEWSTGKPRLGYVPQSLEYDRSFPLTVAEYCALNHPGGGLWWGGLPRRWRCEVGESLEAVGVGALGDRLLGTLSGGQLQRVLLAAALLGDPEVLLLDEPCANIDRDGTEALRQLLLRLHQARGLTTVFVSHDLHFVTGLAETVCCLNQSHCALGTPAAVLSPHHFQPVGPPWLYATRSVPPPLRP